MVPWCIQNSSHSIKICNIHSIPNTTPFPVPQISDYLVYLSKLLIIDASCTSVSAGHLKNNEHAQLAKSSNIMFAESDKAYH